MGEKQVTGGITNDRIFTAGGTGINVVTGGTVLCSTVFSIAEDPHSVGIIQSDLVAGDGDGGTGGRSAVVGQGRSRAGSCADDQVFLVHINAVGIQRIDIAAAAGGARVIAGAGVVVTGVAGVIGQIIGGGLAGGQVQHSLSIDIAVDGNTAGQLGTTTGSLQGVLAAGAVALDNDLIVIDCESGHGEGIIGIGRAGIANITVVHVGEVQGLAVVRLAIALCDLDGITLLQVDGVLTQITVVSGGVVMAEQEDDVQRLTGLVQHIKQQVGIVIVATVGIVQGQVGHDENRLLIAVIC